MKHRITFLSAVLLLLAFVTQPLRVVGQTRDEVVAYTLDGTITDGSSGYATESEITQEGITWMVTGNTTISPWRIGGKSLTEEDRPLYSTNPISDNITKIVVTHGTANSITVNSMTLIVSANADFTAPTSTLTGDFVAEDEVTFERPTGADWSNQYFKIIYNVTVSGNSNKFVQFVSAEFYKVGSGNPSVATPTFSPAGGTYAEPQNVTISCTTAGATIHYTLDGTNPTTTSAVYSSPIAISETTTVKAMGVKAGMDNSSIATATYTIQDVSSINTIAALWDLANTVGSTPTLTNVTFNNWYVSAVKGSTAYITDGQYGFVIYQSNHGFAAGDKLNGTVSCNVLMYQNRYAEITGVHASDLTVTSNQEVPEYSASIASLVLMNYSTILNLGTLIYDGSCFADVAGDTIVPYNNFNLSDFPTLVAGQQYQVKGMFMLYNDIKEIAPRSAEDFLLVGGTYYNVTVASGIANGTVSVSPTTAIEGATITVTATPAVGYELETLTYSYTGSSPINISQTTMQFTMPAADVTVNATFSETQGPTPITIAEARALALDEYALVQGVVTFIDGRSIYIQDATAGIDLFLNTNTVPEALAIGDMVQAYGKRAEYKGLVELSEINGGNPNEFNILSNGNTLPLAVKTIAEILDDFSGSNMLQSTRVKIQNAIIGAIDPGSNTPISQGENTMNIYKIPTVEGLLEGDDVTVIGIIGCYNTVQLRINSASDIEFTHPQSDVVATPTFSPAAGTYYTTQNVTIACATEGATIHYTTNGATPTASSPVYSSPLTISATTTVKAIGMKEGLENSAIATAVYTITDAPAGSDYTRIFDLSQLGNGAQVILAARYNENVNEYYAMTAETSGKPEGVLFTSVPGTAGETLPSTIADEASTYSWTLTIDGSNYTFTNAAGNVLGYNSSTNFATGGDNTGWTIENGTSEGGMVPEYSAFVITNANVAARAIALNSNHNFGPYAKSNMTSDSYNFFLDIFATAGSTPTCATPTFSPAGGTYFETQTVTIASVTNGATIHYTTNGTTPTASSPVYSAPITVAETTTIKAIAMKEGFENSSVATATYNIITGAATIFSQDWEGDMNGWTFVTVEGSKPWIISEHNGNHYAYANGYNGGANVQWCISPAFNLNIYSNVSLSFRNAKNYIGPDMKLFISNNYNGENPATATWTELDFNKSTGSFAWAESGIIDLADFSGSNCYIGFKYISTETEAAAWEVDDVILMGSTTEPYLTVSPNTLTGFTHVIGQGPSAPQTFVLTAGNITPAPGGTSGIVHLTVMSPFSISLDNEDYSNEIYFNNITNLAPTTIYVRMNGTSVGPCTGVVNVNSSASYLNTTVTLSGTVTEPGQVSEWNRVYALTDLHDGDQVILAARYDATVGNGYYAMTAEVSGKPDGVLFTSVNNGGVETLPESIASDADTYLWNVTVSGDVITLTNAAGDALGYGSSTNFAGNTSIEWTIAYETAGENAMVPNYTGFLITNAETTNRCIVMNASHKFGAYHTNNINNPDYNFYLDLFVQGGSATPTVATPVFSMASGTYYEEIDVTITCSTEGAIIRYTTDGTDPTTSSTVYTGAIHIDQDMTLKAIAMKDGYDNSGIATANYVIMTDVQVILSQDWEGEMNGWTFVTVEGNKPWSIGTYNGNKYAYANGYGDDVDNQQWCISPAFNLEQYAGQNVTLTFMNAMNYSGPDLDLFIADDYDGEDPESASWLPLSFNMSTGGYAWTESGPISLSGLGGESCNIGFRYTSTVSKGAAAWEVDDIMIIVEAGNAPYLNATPNALTGFQHYINAGPSEQQTFVVTGGNLPTDSNTEVVLTVNNDNFKISLNGLYYTNSISLTPVNGVLAPTTIHVRLFGTQIGTLSSQVNIACGNTSTTVNLTGTVLDNVGVGENLADFVGIWSRNNEIMIENNSGNDLPMVVYNLLGQSVMSSTITTGSIQMPHHLAKGMYIVTLQCGQGMMSSKIVVR